MLDDLVQLLAHRVGEGGVEAARERPVSAKRGTGISPLVARLTELVPEALRPWVPAHLRSLDRKQYYVAAPSMLIMGLALATCIPLAAQAGSFAGTTGGAGGQDFGLAVGVQLQEPELPLDEVEHRFALECGGSGLR